MRVYLQKSCYWKDGITVIKSQISLSESQRGAGLSGQALVPPVVAHREKAAILGCPDLQTVVLCEPHLGESVTVKISYITPKMEIQKFPRLRLHVPTHRSWFHLSPGCNVLRRRTAQCRWNSCRQWIREGFRTLGCRRRPGKTPLPDACQIVLLLEIWWIRLQGLTSVLILFSLMPGMELSYAPS